MRPFKASCSLYFNTVSPIIKPVMISLPSLRRETSTLIFPVFRVDSIILPLSSSTKKLSMPYSASRNFFFVSRMLSTEPVIVLRHGQNCLQELSTSKKILACHHPAPPACNDKGKGDYLEMDNVPHRRI